MNCSSAGSEHSEHPNKKSGNEFAIIHWSVDPPLDNLSCLQDLKTSGFELALGLVECSSQISLARGTQIFNLIYNL